MAVTVTLAGASSSSSDFLAVPHPIMPLGGAASSSSVGLGTPNYFPDPSFETDALGVAPPGTWWSNLTSGAGSAFTTSPFVQAADAASGSRSLRWAGTVDTGGSNLGVQAGVGSSGHFPVVSGPCAIGIEWTAHSLPTNVYLRFTLQTYPSTATITQYGTIGWNDPAHPQISSGQWLTASWNILPGDTSALLWIIAENWAATVQSVDLSIDAIAVFCGAISWLGYNDGDSPGWVWTGARGSSISQPLGAPVFVSPRLTPGGGASASASAMNNFIAPVKVSISASSSLSGDNLKLKTPMTMNANSVSSNHAEIFASRFFPAHSNSSATMFVDAPVTLVFGSSNSTTETEINLGNPNVAQQFVYRMAAGSLSSSNLNVGPYILLDSASSVSLAKFADTAKTYISTDTASSTSAVIARLRWGFDPQVIQIYRLSALGTAIGINGLSVVFAGAPILPQQSFDVAAAIRAAAAQGALNNQIQVCDNALKQALDEAPYIERVS